MKVLKYGVPALVILILLGTGLKKFNDSRFFSGYDPAAPLNSRIASTENLPGYALTKFYFESGAGDEVPALLAQPDGLEAPMPCIVLLHGIGQKKEDLNDIAPIICPAGFALATFDQYTRGERRLPKDASGLQQLRAFKARAAKTVNETRKLIDYLCLRPDIAHDRIYLLGASYGAVTGSTAMALDKRIAAGVMLYGGGDYSILLDSPAVDDELGVFAKIVKPLTNAYFRPSDPIYYVAGITPRPVLFQNGKADSVVVPAAARALQEAALEPKEVIWYEGDHVGLDLDTTRKVLDDTRDWFLKQDLPFRSASAEAIPAAQGH